jgi:phosphatidylglycerophosphate synthase
MRQEKERLQVAVVVCAADDSAPGRLALRVGGLSLLTRCLLALRHAGFLHVAVVGGAAQRDALTAQWSGDARLEGVDWLDAGEAAAKLPQRCLLVLPDVVVTSGELCAWVERVSDAAEAAAPDQSGLGPAVLSSALLPAGIEAARGGGPGLAGFLGRLAVAQTLEIVPYGGAVREAVASPPAALAALWKMLKALRTPDDGPIVDRFVNRTFSAWISRRLVDTPLTPNQVTIASLLAGLGGAWALGSGDWPGPLAGLALFQLSVILDHVDGEIARVKYQFSRFGKWLDNWSDHAVDLAVVAMLAWRVWRDGSAGQPVLLGVAAAIGVTGSFAIVFWWSLAAERAGGRIPAVILAMANRDGFSLALWTTGLLGRPVWFLWALAVGANVFWALWLARAGLPPRSGR